MKDPFSSEQLDEFILFKSIFAEEYAIAFENCRNRLGHVSNHKRNLETLKLIRQTIWDRNSVVKPCVEKKKRLTDNLSEYMPIQPSLWFSILRYLDHYRAEDESLDDIFRELENLELKISEKLITKMQRDRKKGKSRSQRWLNGKYYRGCKGGSYKPSHYKDEFEWSLQKNLD